jgi:hypothetical protein
MTREWHAKGLEYEGGAPRQLQRLRPNAEIHAAGSASPQVPAATEVQDRCGGEDSQSGSIPSASATGNRIIGQERISNNTTMLPHWSRRMRFSASSAAAAAVADVLGVAGLVQAPPGGTPPMGTPPRGHSALVDPRPPAPSRLVHGGRAALKLDREVPGLLRDPGRVGVGRRGGYVNASR